jgi:GNAT superfamily N-acetyltransferase
VAVAEPVRRGTAADAADIGRLLHDFNTEYHEITPGPDALAERIAQLIDADAVVLLVGDGPDGLAVLRFRRSIWTAGLECYLAELYVVPALRGQGLGRGLMEAALELARKRGADWMELNTDEGDVAARALYERLGFKATAEYYEREL